MVGFATITPLFNGARYIEETMCSLLGQAAPEDELVVVDDGSTDGGADLAEQLDARIRVIRRANAGEASAVNTGVAATEAPVIAVINADDPVAPGLFAAMRAAFDADPDLSAAYPDWIRIDAAGRELSRHTAPVFDCRVLLGAHLCIPGPGAFFRRAHMRDEPVRDPAAWAISDYDFWLRFAMRNRSIRRVPGFLAKWRAHSEGATVTAQSARLARSRIAVMERLFRRADLPEDYKGLRRLAMSAAHYNAALIGLRAKDIPVRRHLVQSYLWQTSWPDFVPKAQRRSGPRMTYLALQPLSWLLHGALDPILPPQYRRAAVVEQTFGVVPEAAR